MSLPRTNSTSLKHHKVSEEFNAKISELDEGETPKVFKSMRTVSSAADAQERYAMALSVLLGSALSTLWSAIVFLVLGSTLTWWVAVQPVFALVATVLWITRAYLPLSKMNAALTTMELAPPEFVVTTEGAPPPPKEDDELPMVIKMLYVARAQQAYALRSKFYLSAVVGAWMTSLWAAGLHSPVSFPFWALAIPPAVFLVYAAVARTRYTQAEIKAAQIRAETGLTQRPSE